MRHGGQLANTHHGASVGHGIEKDEARPWYDIPYRSIVVKGVDNLFVTGRCLGAEFIVQSSLRVQHSVRSSGEAAGIAAAMAIDAGIPAREVHGKKVRETIDFLLNREEAHNQMFRDAFNKVQETGSNRDFGTTKAAKMYFSLSNPGPNTFATGETHAPSFN